MTYFPPSAPRQTTVCFAAQLWFIARAGLSCVLTEIGPWKKISRDQIIKDSLNSLRSERLNWDCNQTDTALHSHGLENACLVCGCAYIEPYVPGSVWRIVRKLWQLKRLQLLNSHISSEHAWTGMLFPSSLATPKLGQTWVQEGEKSGCLPRAARHLPYRMRRWGTSQNRGEFSGRQSSACVLWSSLGNLPSGWNSPPRVNSEVDSLYRKWEQIINDWQNFKQIFISDNGPNLKLSVFASVLIREVLV